MCCRKNRRQNKGLIYAAAAPLAAAALDRVLGSSSKSHEFNDQAPQSQAMLGQTTGITGLTRSLANTSISEKHDETEKSNDYPIPVDTQDLPPPPSYEHAVDLRALNPTEDDMYPYPEAYTDSYPPQPRPTFPTTTNPFNQISPDQPPTFTNNYMNEKYNTNINTNNEANKTLPSPPFMSQYQTHPSPKVQTALQTLLQALQAYRTNTAPKHHATRARKDLLNELYEAEISMRIAALGERGGSSRLRCGEKSAVWRGLDGLDREIRGVIWEGRRERRRRGGCC